MKFNLVHGLECSTLAQTEGMVLSLAGCNFVRN
jgi:hypothetical protein